MYLIQDSRDLLYVVLAFCALWLTIFLAWFIYYLAMMLRQFYLVVKSMRERIDKIDEVIKAVKEKVEQGASVLHLISEGVHKIADLAKERSKSRRSSKAKAKK